MTDSEKKDANTPAVMECAACGNPIPSCRCTKPRVVVCAANRSTKTGRIVCGARHWDEIMRQIALFNPGDGSGLKMTFEWQGCEQGFIDQFGQWMTREEAWAVAKAAGQIKYSPTWDANSGTLYSEDIY